jgi:Ca2+/Na+ antiporter
MNPGLVGGIIGSLVGILGGAVGTYFSIKNARGPKERSFIIRMAVLMWIAATVFVVLLVIVPSPYIWLLCVTYGIVLLLSTITMNRRLGRIREQEDRTV